MSALENPGLKSERSDRTVGRIESSSKMGICTSFLGTWGTCCRISLFRVESDGEFPIHRHAHAHVFYFLSGEGKCWIGTKTYKIQPGYVALIAGGEEHGYKNTGKIPMLFVVLNSPATR